MVQADGLRMLLVPGPLRAKPTLFRTRNGAPVKPSQWYCANELSVHQHTMLLNDGQVPLVFEPSCTAQLEYTGGDLARPE
jgi:hypothetical protein